MEAGASAPPKGGSPYGTASVVGAALAALFFPLISLIVALLLLGAQGDPAKRRSLRAWALASAAWLVLGVLIVLALWAGLGGSSSGVDRIGPCVGGPKLNATGNAVPGSTTRFVVPCAISGTETVTFPNKSH
jgi:fumarate reductase subunit D